MDSLNLKNCSGSSSIANTTTYTKNLSSCSARPKVSMSASSGFCVDSNGNLILQINDGRTLDEYALGEDKSLSSEPTKYEIYDLRSQMKTYGKTYLEKKEGNNMEFKKLLELWYSRSKEVITDYKETNYSSITGSNKFLKKLTELEKEFSTKLTKLNNEFVKQNGYDLLDEIDEDFVTVDVNSVCEKEIEAVKEIVAKNMRSLTKLYNEVSARLSFVQDSKEVMEVLTTYDIVDDKGKLKDYIVTE